MDSLERTKRATGLIQEAWIEFEPRFGFANSQSNFLRNACFSPLRENFAIYSRYDLFDSDFAAAICPFTIRQSSFELSRQQTSRRATA